MRHAIAIAMIGALALAGCKAKPAAPATDESGAPQVATSIDDADLPVDKSAQITAIDAATSDASGMPADGGAAVVVKPQHEAATTVTAAAPVADNAQAAAPAAKPGFTIDDVPGTN